MVYYLICLILYNTFHSMFVVTVSVSFSPLHFGGMPLYRHAISYFLGFPLTKTDFLSFSPHTFSTLP
jgi:hypothetical protein